MTDHEYYQSLDKGTETRETAYKNRRRQMIDNAQEGTLMMFHNGMSYRYVAPADLLLQHVKDEAMQEACRAFIVGDKQKAHELFDAACELAFEAALEFVVDCDVELGD